MRVVRNVLSCSILVGIAAVLVAFSAPLPAPDTWVPFGSNATPQPPQLSRLPAGAEELNARLQIPGLLTTTVPTAVGPRVLLELTAGGITNEIGSPRLPVLRYMLETPPGAIVVPSLRPLDLKTRRLESFGWTTPLFAVQQPVPKIPGAEEAAVYQENPLVYGADRYFPKQQVEIIDYAIIRGRWITTLEIRPFRYNPVQKTLEYWTEADLIIRLDPKSKSSFSGESARRSSVLHDQALESQLIPIGIPAPIPFGAGKGSGGGAAEGAEGLLIVVHDSLVDAIAPLVDWRKKTGWKVEVLKTSAIGTNPTDAQIKSAIDSRYHSWSNPSLGFLLLVGDTNLVAHHTGNGGGNSQAADNWYGCLDGTDYLPELAMGRISTRTPQETSDVVAKFMTYYKATFPTDAWVKKAGFIGTSDSGHISQIEGTHDYCINTFLTPNGYQKTAWTHGGTSCDRHYNTTNATTADISNSINDGRSIVNYSGHGGETSWQGPTSNGGYDQDNVRANTNAGMYPFVISNACVTGTYDIDECFGETWLKVANRGAIGFWGASNSSYWDEDDYLQRSLYTHIFPMDSTPPLGVILNLTKLDNYNHFGNVGNTAYYYDMYNLLGDPTTSLWTRQPMTMSVTYPSGIPLGETKLDFTVTANGQPLPNALVAVRKAGEPVFEGAYTDAQGKLTLTLDPAPKDIGTLELTVTKHDYRPFEATIQIFRPDTPWLVYREHQIHDQVGGDGDGSANPGETLEIPVTLENVGDKAGTGIHSTLSTNTPTLVTVLDAEADFPDAAPATRVTSLPDHYKVQVAGSAGDNQVMGFDLHWHAADGSEGTTSFTEIIKTVNFEFRSYSIDDSAGGNGNGVAGPGETADMTIKLANVGHKDAVTIHGKLTTTSPYITILSGDADFPNLPAGTEGNSLPPAYRFQVSPSAPDNKPVTFQLEVTEQGSHYTEILPIEVMISSCAKSNDATDVPKPINDNATIESRFDYPNSIVINELNVFVNIAHSYTGDIKVWLISPAGTTVLLHDRTGGSNDNIVAWYDTELQPAEPMSRFNGENAQGIWILRVEDCAGGDTGSIVGWKLEVCGEGATPQPRLAFSGKTMDDNGTCDPDGFADVGELVTYNVKIKNRGSLPATGVKASLSSTSKVAVQNNPVALPDIAPGAEAEALFKVQIGAVGCMENAAFTLSLTSNEGVWTDGFNDTLEADSGYKPTTEDLEHGGTPPAGWTHSAISGTDDWQVSSNFNHTTSGSYSWFVTDAPTTKDVYLVTPTYQVNGSNSTFSFWHRVDLQGEYDGGVLEISTDGGSNWSDLGPNMTAGGYHKKLLGGPLKDRDAWTGPRGANWINTIVTLGSWSGQSIKIRFRLSCNENTARTGWNIDDVVFTSFQTTCDTHPCGIPKAVQFQSVAKENNGVLLTWNSDVVAQSYKMLRSADPTHASAFADVTAEDSDPADTKFFDQSSGNFACWIVVPVGPDGEGPWEHFNQ